jgi:hypothetical protein
MADLSLRNGRATGTARAPQVVQRAGTTRADDAGGGGRQAVLRAVRDGTSTAHANQHKSDRGNVMSAAGSLGMNVEDDGWADDLAERWFEEFETEQGDEPSRDDQSAVVLGRY